MNRVQATPPLPYPDGKSLDALAQFDKDIRKALYQYLMSVASRLNGVMPKDGSEPFTGPVNIAINNDITGVTQLDAPLNIGTYAGNNMMIDGNELQTRTNGVASLFSANLFGGNITFGDTSTIFTLNGGKIKFPATQQASSDVNTLDDYERGTWTPTLQFGGAATGMTYSVRNGDYVKIGRFVYLSCVVTLSAKGSSTGTALMTGMPFTSANNKVGSGAVGSYANMANLNFSPVTSIGFSVTNIALRQHSGAGTGTFTALNETHFTDTSTLNFAITHMVD